MHSSTSNSRTVHAPEEKYGRLWAITVAIALVILGGIEITWRKLGWQPSVEDTLDFWCTHRDSIQAPNTVVLVGASHMMCGFDPGVFHERLPTYKLANLARVGQPPIATLRDLADDDSFSGLVLVDLVEHYFEEQSWDAQQGPVDYYHDRFSLNRKLNSQIASQLQSRFTVLAPGLSLNPTANFLIPALRDRRFPSQTQIFSTDRSTLIDFSKSDSSSLSQGNAGRLAYIESHLEHYRSDPPEWAGMAAAVTEMISRIRSRGGEVMVIRFPHSGAYYELERAAYPRTDYWDRFAAMTEGLTFHFEDHEKTASMQCPDYTHLDKTDARIMTSVLIDALVAHGALEESNED